MALLWIEGFEGFGTTINVAPSPAGMLGRKYPSTYREFQMEVKTGRNGFAIMVDDSECFFRSPPLTTHDTMILGCAIKVEALPGVGVESPLMTLLDGIDVGINLRLQPDGTIDIYRLDTFMGRSTGAMATNTWYYMELKVKVAPSPTGFIYLEMNEVNWFTAESTVTQGTTHAWHTGFQIGLPRVATHYDDLYVLDGSGSINNDFLGPRKVVAIRPNASGDDTDWTPDAGSNYDRVNEAELDEDGSYVETGNSGDQDLYNYDNTSNLTEVTGIQIVTEAKVTSGSMELQAVTKSGATEDVQSYGTIVSTDYGTSSAIGELNPDTSLPWTPGEIDAARFGVKAI